MLRGYHQAASTLNLLRAFTKGGFADLGQVHIWTQEFVANSPEGRRYEQLATEIQRAMSFMTAIGVDMRNPALHQTDIWTSHEALLLDFEEALTRRDSPDRRLVRLLGPLPLDRRADPPPGRRARRVPRRRPQPRRRQARAGGDPGGGARALRGRSTRTGARPADADRAHGRRPGGGDAAAARPRRARRRPPGRLGLRPDARQHVPHRRRAGRRATSATSSPRSRASSPSTTRRGRGRAASTSRSPATTSPSASAAATASPRSSSTTPIRRSATRA